MGTLANATNGTPTNGVKNLTPNPQTTGKDEMPKTPGAEPPKFSVLKIEKKETPIAQPLEDRLHRLNQLFEIQTKYNRLQQSKVMLNDFKLKKDVESITLTLSDYNNRSSDFSTKNPDVIKSILDCLKNTIDDKLKEIEPKLIW